MSTKKFDAVATIGEYTDRNGQAKKRYLNVGSVFESDKGLSLKIDALPLSKEWSGWIQFYPPKDRDAVAAPKAPSAPAPADFDDELTF